MFLTGMLSVLTALPANAQTYPERPITLIVPFVAGGGADAVGRVIANGMSAQLNQPIVIENVGGAGGTLGAGRGARAQPDGYTLTLTHLGQAPALLSIGSFLSIRSATSSQSASLRRFR
jgi:tripartite-type tricarboxylate transporter receptor subunit TctC